MLLKRKPDSFQAISSTLLNNRFGARYKSLDQYIVQEQFYLVHAIEYYQIPFVYIYTDDAERFPYPYPLEFFEVVDARLSKYFCFGETIASPVNDIAPNPLIAFREWAENPNFFHDLVEGKPYTKVAQTYKEKMEVEFFNPNLNISEEPAAILDPKMSWLFCPACTESWEVKTDDELTACPSCGLYYHNPFIKKGGEES